MDRHGIDLVVCSVRYGAAGPEPGEGRAENAIAKHPGQRGSNSGAGSEKLCDAAAGPVSA